MPDKVGKARLPKGGKVCTFLGLRAGLLLDGLLGVEGNQVQLHPLLMEAEAMVVEVRPGERQVLVLLTQAEVVEGKVIAIVETQGPVVQAALAS